MVFFAASWYLRTLRKKVKESEGGEFVSGIIGLSVDLLPFAVTVVFSCFFSLDLWYDCSFSLKPSPGLIVFWPLKRDVVQEKCVLDCRISEWFCMPEFSTSAFLV